MKKLFQHFSDAPILKIIIYCIAFTHIVFCYDSIANFGIGFTTDTQLRTLVIIGFSIIWIATCWDNRFFYYTYIGATITCMLLVFAIKDYNKYQTIFRALFPFYLIFSGVLILDLKRVIFLAHSKE